MALRFPDAARTRGRSLDVKSGAFIERDGILSRVRVEHGHQVSPLTLEDFHLNLEAVHLLTKLKAVGLLLIATTNQPGLSRGYQSRRELDRMHELLRTTFSLDDILVCPHDESDCCSCRKPKPGLLVEAGFKWNLDLNRCFVVSDKWPDAQAARSAGCTSLLLQSPWLGTVHRDFILPDFASIVDKILSLKLTNGPVR
jgi:D-glycero-D-manno-heptose 1,7-bisphosphate phosphatase